MDSLTDCLQTRTWRELRMIAHAHDLPFNTHHTCTQARRRLHDSLLGGQLRRSLRTLGEPERAALAAVQAASGSLPLYRFVAAFGEIRPYRPWREDAPRKPWRRPVSAAERLWFLGFVTILPGAPGRPRRVVLPDEVLAMLPPLPRPRIARRRLARPAASPDRLRVDVAALVGTLSGHRVRPRWGRWLPPYALKAINARLRLPDRVAGVRSELHTGRLRFLHYLAEAAQLVSLQNGLILPTPAASTWLALPAPEQWRWLWDAVTRDLAQRRPLWNTYRFTPLSPDTWNTLTTLLHTLEPGRTMTIRSLARTLAPYLPDDPTRDSVLEVLRGPLVWAGITVVQDGRFMLTRTGAAALASNAGAFTDSGSAALVLSDHAITVKLPDIPRTRPFAALAAWVMPDAEGWRIDAETVARAEAQGRDHADIARVLGELCGQMPTREVFDQLAAWSAQAHTLELRSMAVLTCPDSDLLAGLRQDSRLRGLFAESLGPHAIAVAPHAVTALQQALVRRGHGVLAPSTPGNRPAPPPSDFAEYAWLAVSVYRSLSAFVDLPIRIPAAVEVDLAAQLPAPQISALETVTEAVGAALARAIDGYAALPPPLAQDDPAGVRAAVSAAYADRTPLTVEYFSPGYGTPTVRTITPLLPITEADGAEYVEAWCATAGAARTFRLDRILRVLDR